MGGNLNPAAQVAEPIDPLKKNRASARFGDIHDPRPNAERLPGAAGVMAVDEIIDPAETRAWLRQYVDRLRIEVPPPGQVKPLAYWPTCL